MCAELGCWMGLGVSPAAPGKQRRRAPATFLCFGCTLNSDAPQVIHEGKDPLQVVTENMSRPLKPEVGLEAGRGCACPSLC